MEIQLDLSRHCIETELKRLYDLSLSRYFKTKGMSKEMEEKVEQIGHAMETLDFPSLRSRFPDLAGGSPKSISLSTDKHGKIRIHIDAKQIVSL